MLCSKGRVGSSPTTGTTRRPLISQWPSFVFQRNRQVFGEYHGQVNETLPPCPECSSDLAYEMGSILVCPLCGHEWAPVAAEDDAEPADAAITDAFGTLLADGDTVTVIKDLKIKGSSTVVKVGTKVRNIRLVDGVGDHDIDCKIDGVGPMQLKSSVVKKV